MPLSGITSSLLPHRKSLMQRSSSTSSSRLRLLSSLLPLTKQEGLKLSATKGCNFEATLFAGILVRRVPQYCGSQPFKRVLFCRRQTSVRSAASSEAKTPLGWSAFCHLIAGHLLWEQDDLPFRATNLRVRSCTTAHQFLYTGGPPAEPNCSTQTSSPVLDVSVLHTFSSPALLLDTSSFVSHIFQGPTYCCIRLVQLS